RRWGRGRARAAGAVGRPSRPAGRAGRRALRAAAGRARAWHSAGARCRVLRQRLEVDEEDGGMCFARDQEEENRDHPAVRGKRREQGRQRKPLDHGCSGSQRLIPGSSAPRAARATPQPKSLIGPPKRPSGPRPVAATTTASVDVPLAPRPSSHRRSAAASSDVLTSVTVMTALTSAADSAAPSTTTIELIVDGAQTPSGVWPAVMRFDSPTVTTASAIKPDPSAAATTAFSLTPDVSTPTHGP